MNPTVEEWQIKAKELHDKISGSNETYQLNILTQALIDAYYNGAENGIVLSTANIVKVIQKRG